MSEKRLRTIFLSNLGKLKYSFWFSFPEKSGKLFKMKAKGLPNLLIFLEAN